MTNQSICDSVSNKTRNLSLVLKTVFYVTTTTILQLVAMSFPRLTSANSNDSIWGTIEPPPGVEAYNQGSASIGIINFLSSLIKIATVAAGIWTLINFILAGWIYLTAGGDSSAHEKVSQKMINSLIGLILVAMAYTIAGIIGLLVFGDPAFILQPTLTTVNDFQ